MSGTEFSQKFDFETTDFLLPILTVQPLVENAVRHDVTKKIKGGTITISTHRKTECISIIVADDDVWVEPNVGSGTAQLNQAERSHVGIINVRSRLDARYGGTLTIESAKGKSTICTITIPRKKAGDVQ